MTAIPRASRGDRRAASRARRGEALDSATGTHGVRCCETAAAAGSFAGIARDAEARRRVGRASPRWGSDVKVGREAAAAVLAATAADADAAPPVAGSVAVPVTVVVLPVIPVAGIALERELPLPVAAVAAEGAGEGGAADTGAAGPGAGAMPLAAGRGKRVPMAGPGGWFTVAGEIDSAAGMLDGSSAEWLSECGVRRAIPPNPLMG